MTLDVEALAKSMLEAALPFLKNYGGYAIETAQGEFSTIAGLVQKIGVDYLAGKTTELEARELLASAKLAYKNAWDMENGAAAIAMEDAVNAALGAVATTVNTFVGFVLL